jgi:hypothetical protein
VGLHSSVTFVARGARKIYREIIVVIAKNLEKSIDSSAVAITVGARLTVHF